MKRIKEPLWPPFVAMLAIGGLYSTLPSSLVGGAPRWLLTSIVVVLLALILIFHYRGNHFLHQLLGYILNSVVTIALIVSFVLLLSDVAGHQIAPRRLLFSAAALWISNFLIFASWYWRLDGGGPHERAQTPGHTDGAILFPQMTLSEDVLKETGQENWSPNFVDYLFLAANTSTAFSPTDAPVLAPWAKLLMMLQSLLSLLIIALLAARAVNIL